MAPNVLLSNGYKNMKWILVIGQGCDGETTNQEKEREREREKKKRELKWERKRKNERGEKERRERGRVREEKKVGKRDSVKVIIHKFLLQHLKLIRKWGFEKFHFLFPK